MPPKTERFEMRLDADTLKRIDEWRRFEPDLPSRAEAIRRLVNQALDQEAAQPMRRGHAARPSQKRPGRKLG